MFCVKKSKVIKVHLFCVRTYRSSNDTLRLTFELSASCEQSFSLCCSLGYTCTCQFLDVSLFQVCVVLCFLIG